MEEKENRLIEIPDPSGNYINPEGLKVRFHKVPFEKIIHTRHKVHTGSTIKQFLKDNEGYKTVK